MAEIILQAFGLLRSQVREWQDPVPFEIRIPVTIWTSRKYNEAGALSFGPTDMTAVFRWNGQADAIKIYDLVNEKEFLHNEPQSGI